MSGAETFSNRNKISTKMTRKVAIVTGAAVCFPTCNKHFKQELMGAVRNGRGVSYSLSIERLVCGLC